MILFLFYRYLIIIYNKYLIIDYNYMKKKIKAICLIQGKCDGSIELEEYGKKRVRTHVLLSKLEPFSFHAIHIHETGDLRKGCLSLKAHYNPHNKTHGGPNDKNRHVGDLGNIYFDKKGEAKYSFQDDYIKLRGTKANIIGRSVVIHADRDDLGLGGHKDSLTTGHAGARITCAVIGYSKKMFHK